MAIYKSAAAALIDSCNAYRDREMTLPALKARVWEAAQSIVAIEEKALRSFLQQAEGRLDMVEHTRDEDEVFAATLRIVREIEDELRAYLADDDADATHL